MMQHDHLKSQFLLNPAITFLNFGSFGACPKPIFETYQNLQLQLEQEPVQFIAFRAPSELLKARTALAGYVHCDADDLVYVSNPSYAVNIIAKSFQLNPGDEVLSTNIEYGACDRIWSYYCEKAGAKYVRQHIQLPLTSKEQFIEDFFAGVTPRTKAVFISHITSSTALLFPVKEIVAIAKAKGLFTMVDGAHAPGHIPLDITDIDADAYTGACHKWMCAPKGCSFLYVRKALQPLFDPLVVSWGYKAASPSASQFIDYHQMQGTRDFSAFLTVPKVLEFLAANNWPEVAARCRQLAQAHYQRFCDLLHTSPLAPISNEFLGQMCSMQINTPAPEKLQRLLYEKYKIEIPVMRQDDKVYIRYSINAFNSEKDLDTLYDALEDIITTTDLLPL